MTSVPAGAAISRGTVFWGTGYAQLGVPNLDGGGRLYAFGPAVGAQRRRGAAHVV